MSSPCRTTSLLVLKKSNGWIFHDPREKEDVLSLKMKNKTYCIHFPFFLSTFAFPFCFIPSFCFSFLFLFSYLTLLSIFSSFSLLLIGHFLTFLEKSSSGQWEEIASSFPQTKMWLSFFHPFLLFLNPTFMTSSPTWLNMSHEFLSYTWLNCEPILFMPSVTLLWCQVSPS